MHRWCLVQSYYDAEKLKWDEENDHKQGLLREKVLLWQSMVRQIETEYRREHDQLCGRIKKCAARGGGAVFPFADVLRPRFMCLLSHINYTAWTLGASWFSCGLRRKTNDISVELPALRKGCQRKTPPMMGPVRVGAPCVVEGPSGE